MTIIPLLNVRESWDQSVGRREESVLQKNGLCPGSHTVESSLRVEPDRPSSSPSRVHSQLSFIYLLQVEASGAPLQVSSSWAMGADSWGYHKDEVKQYELHDVNSPSVL